MSNYKGFKLKVAISMLVIITVTLMTVINWYISYASLRNTLTENFLNNNHQYTVKVASSTTDLFKNMKQNLDTLSQIVSIKELNQSEINQWGSASDGYFNSIFTTDENGVVQLISPFDFSSNSLMKPGTKITSDLMEKALQQKKPFISEPYHAQSGNLMILLSYPVFDPSGNYKGVVDGTIYLESDSSLKRILNQHDLSNNSVVFVVDRKGQIIYHPDSSFINQSVTDQADVQNVMQGQSGSAKILSRNGDEFFSGFALIEETGWGIIARTPVTVMEKPLQELTFKLIIRSLPILIIFLFLSWFFANRLVKPINILARFSEEAVQTKQTLNSFHRLHINSSIYEVKQLYQHINKYFQQLDDQLQQDGLTGALNRRAFDQKIGKLVERNIPFFLIIVDIDHFKKINDEFGHLIGDDVLRSLSSIMMEAGGERETCYRYGGEEFIILSTEKDINVVFALAERIRMTVALTSSPSEKSITISIGISSLQEKDEAPQDVIKRADIALYQSKHNGRNQTTVYEFQSFTIENAR